jgi:hypothetical protein
MTCKIAIESESTYRVVGRVKIDTVPASVYDQNDVSVVEIVGYIGGTGQAFTYWGK